MNEDFEEFLETEGIEFKDINKTNSFGINFSLLDEFPMQLEPGSLLERSYDLLFDCMMAFDEAEDIIREYEDRDCDEIRDEFRRLMEEEFSSPKFAERDEDVDDEVDFDEEQEDDIVFDGKTSALIQRMIVTLQTLNPDLTPEAVVAFVAGMKPHNRTLSLCRYIDLGMVQQGWCDIDVAMSGQMCEVYAACSTCTGRDGKPLKPRSIQAALMRYYKKQQA